METVESGGKGREECRDAGDRCRTIFVTSLSLSASRVSFTQRSAFGKGLTSRELESPMLQQLFLLLQLRKRVYIVSTSARLRILQSLCEV